MSSGTSSTMPPKRIADYFFMVGLPDDSPLFPSPTSITDAIQDTQASNNDSNDTISLHLGTIDAGRGLGLEGNLSSGLVVPVSVGSVLVSPPPSELREHRALPSSHSSHSSHGNTASMPIHTQLPSSDKDPSTTHQNPIFTFTTTTAASNKTATHTSVFDKVLPSAPRDPSSLLSDPTAVYSPNRTRSKSMAHFHPPPGLERLDTDEGILQQASTESFRQVRPPRRMSTASLMGPPRRAVTMSNISNPGGAMLQHKPSYRHVSNGTLFKCVQEGLELELSKSMIEEAEAEAEENTISRPKMGQGDHIRRETPIANDNDKSALSVNDVRSLAFGKNVSMIRSRSKAVAASAEATQISQQGEAILERDQIHPGDRVFTPLFCFPAELSFKLSDEKPQTTYHSFVMTQETGNRSYAMCVTIYERLAPGMHRLFEKICQRWTRNHMSESEIEYAKAIKIKIAKEKMLLRHLQEQLREYKTLGKRQNQAHLRREVVDSEEKLSLLEDQMRPWQGLFVEIDDVWIPRCIGLVSAIPYHYLLRDWLLAVVVACSGGVENPGMSQSSLRLESYVKNLIHEVNLPPFGKLEVGITVNNRLIYASRPALNSVPIVKNFSLFPLFRCLSAEDIVTIIEVILSEGRVIFLSSYLGMLTLASESFLYLLFPLYWQGVYIPILPSALMTCLQAPVPYIIGVERRSCDPDFPPEDACVVDLDKGIIDVQLAPIPLPPRQRKKLVQSLEQYAPTSAIRRSASTKNPSLGPPAYVKEAFPHSRLTLFCGVSRAPRWGKRMESTRQLPAVPVSITTSQPSSLNTSAAQTPVLSATQLQNKPAAAMPPGAFGAGGTDQRETLIGPLIEARTGAVSEGLLSMDIDSRPPLIRSATEPFHEKQLDVEPKDQPRPSGESTAMSDVGQEASPLSQNSTSDSFKTASRKVLSPPRTRTAIFDISKKQENATTPQQPQQPQQQPTSATGGGGVVHPSINRSNSSQSTYINTATGFEGPGLSHRASFTSIDSSSSSVFSKSQMTTGSKAGSPISTMTSNTMNSVNGPYPTSTTTTSGAQTLNGEAIMSGIEPELLATATVEGHVLSSVSRPVPMSLLNCRCGICTRGLASHNEVYRCEGCSLFVHAGCMDELLYPCVPRGFDESGVCWSVLQMWAGLMKGYRSGIIAGAALQQQQLLQQQQQQQQQLVQQQHASPRSYGHAKQLSSSGSENEKEGRDRLSWASFQRWTGRNSMSSASANGVTATTTTTTKGANSFSPPNRAATTVESSHHQHHHHQHRQQTAQPLARTRNGTDSSTHSDTVSFHRDVFMKTIDKDARPFMSAFTESQAFVQFVQDRVDRSPGDPEIMFFDEVIKAKINRSRFRLGKEETKFLDDPSYGVQGTVKAVPPSGDVQIFDTTERRFPLDLDPAYL
ncbi:hypothetical protein BGZ93_005866 [Podila epicladia]|nr:hypothetical protein BGZ93_005866 [Podila epicladia]